MTLTDLHIGLAIKAARTSVGFSARDLARAVNMNPTAISKIENGKQGVSFAEAVAIADVLGLTAGNLADLAAQAGPLAQAKIDADLTLRAAMCALKRSSEKVEP